eukprot:s2842_g3.t1
MYVYQLIDKELPFLGRFSYLFPAAAFLGFVVLEVIVLQATGHFELIKRAAVKWGLLILTTVVTMVALFWTLYMR